MDAQDPTVSRSTGTEIAPPGHFGVWMFRLGAWYLATCRIQHFNKPGFRQGYRVIRLEYGVQAITGTFRHHETPAGADDAKGTPRRKCGLICDAHVGNIYW